MTFIDIRTCIDIGELYRYKQNKWNKWNKWYKSTSDTSGVNDTRSCIDISLVNVALLVYSLGDSSSLRLTSSDDVSLSSLILSHSALNGCLLSFKLSKQMHVIVTSSSEFREHLYGLAKIPNVTFKRRTWTWRVY